MSLPQPAASWCHCYRAAPVAYSGPLSPSRREKWLPVDSLCCCVSFTIALSSYALLVLCRNGGINPL